MMTVWCELLDYHEDDSAEMIAKVTLPSVYLFEANSLK